MEIRWKILIAYCKVKVTDDAMGVIYKGGNLLDRKYVYKLRGGGNQISPKKMLRLSDPSKGHGTRTEEILPNQLPGTSGPDHCSALYILLVKE